MARMRQGDHPLKRYMAKNMVPMAKVCELLNVERTTVWRWFSWKREPTLTNALMIYQLTDGKIRLRTLSLGFYESENHIDMMEVPDTDLL